MEKINPIKGEFYLDMVRVRGSIPLAPTTFSMGYGADAAPLNGAGNAGVTASAAMSASPLVPIRSSACGSACGKLSGRGSVPPLQARLLITYAWADAKKARHAGCAPEPLTVGDSSGQRQTHSPGQRASSTTRRCAGLSPSSPTLLLQIVRDARPCQCIGERRAGSGLTDASFGGPF